MSGQFYVVQTGEAEHWREVLQRCAAYDVYHLPEYHRLAEEPGDVQALLFVYEDDSVVVAMPLLLQRLDGVEGVAGTGYLDATSVYGYPGPVTNASAVSDDVAEIFSISLGGYLESRGVVSAFSRLHPLIEQSSLLSGVGDVVDVGPTVSIDLRLPADEQTLQYRAGHQYDIDKAKESGLVCVHDADWGHLDAFIEIYYETMRRVNADDYYFFHRAYFVRFRELLGRHLQLFVALKDGIVISGSLFTVCNSIIQYHLSGTDSDYLDLAPSKLILDEVRMWGNEVGAKTFHLGGGVGGKKDGVFRFKAGFSDRVHQFKIWRAIVNHEIYHTLTAQQQAWNEQHGVEFADRDYFPAYRAPTRGRD